MRNNEDWFWERFDSDFDEAEDRFNRVFGMALVGVIVGWVVSLALLVGAVVVAWHFLAKVW